MQTGNKNRKRSLGIAGVMVLLLCLPMTAFADAGTALMWAGMLHLAFGNALIGAFEGLLLAWVFHLKPAPAVLVMVAANYFSSWMGCLFLGHQVMTHLEFDLYNAWRWLWWMAGVTFLFTLFLEWPFVLFCLRKNPKKITCSLWGNVLVNSLSYALLFGWYWMASGVTLYTKMNVVALEAMTLPKEGAVYFISQTNSVCKFDFATRQFLKIGPLSADRDDRLMFKSSRFDANNWDIFDTGRGILVSSNLPVLARPSERDQDERTKGTWFDFGPATELAEGSDWSFQTGFWPPQGLRGTNTQTGAHFHFSLETPFVAWIARSATHLPGDYVVFQLGPDQICLLEANTRKIALLARGQGPVVVLPRGT